MTRQSRRNRALCFLTSLGVITACAPGPSSNEPTVDALQSAIATREYWASDTERGQQAPNRESNFRVSFDANERTALVELALTGLGRGNRVAVVPAGVVTHDASRVEIARPDLGLGGWFASSEVGLEQGFTLSQRPVSPGPITTSEEDLVLELAVSQAHASLSGDSVQLPTVGGRPLAYDKVFVVDAEGEPVASRFEIGDHNRIRIVVDDRDATQEDDQRNYRKVRTPSPLPQ